jgi:hypothetical protein
MFSDTLQDQMISNQLAEQKQQKKDVFSNEFLDAFKDTAFRAVQEYLERTAAPQEVQDLLEEIFIITSNVGQPEEDERKQYYRDQFLMNAIACASHNIAAIGGEFHCPSGTTPRRGLKDSLRIHKKGRS